MAKYSAFGTKLSVKDKGGIGTANVIAQVTNISGPGLSFDLADVTSHDQSTPHEYMIPTIIRTGDVTLDIAYDPNDTTHKDLLTRLGNRTLSTFTLEFPVTPAKTWSFDGYVTGFEPNMPTDDALTASVTVKPVGAVTT